jgi:hypothetical protein
VDSDEHAARNVRNGVADAIKRWVESERLGCSIVYGDGGARWVSIYPLEPEPGGDFHARVILNEDAARSILEYESEKGRPPIAEMRPFPPETV